MNPRDFTLHPNAQERAEAEAVWLNEWCEEIKMTFRYKGKRAPVVTKPCSNIVLSPDIRCCVGHCKHCGPQRESRGY